MPSAQVYRIDTVLGDFDPLEEIALADAWTDWPSAVATDSAGNVYFVERGTYRVRKADSSGRVSTVAGNGLLGYGGDGGPATGEEFSAAYGLAADAAGNLYVADRWNDKIRKIDTSGTITTLAGTGSEGRSGDGDPASQARLDKPRGVAVDAAGYVYVADTWNHRVLKVDPAGGVSTFAGTGEPGFSGDGGPAASAQFNYPAGVSVDIEGNVYISDSAGDCCINPTSLHH